LAIGDYVKTTYVAGTTGITAAHLNNIENKVYELDASIVGGLVAINDLNGLTGVTLSQVLTDDAYASEGKCTQAVTTNADVTLASIIATTGSLFVPISKFGYGKYSFSIRAKTDNATAVTAVMQGIVSAKNDAGNYIALATVSFLGTDFANGTGDYSFLYVPFELKHGLSTGVLASTLDLKFEVIAKGSITNNVTISTDMLGVVAVGPAAYA
jgi:hypothetical protein